MADLPRDEYIRRQMWLNRKQPPPSMQGQLDLGDDAEPATVPGTTMFTPEAQQRGLRGVEELRRIHSELPSQQPKTSEPSNRQPPSPEVIAQRQASRKLGFANGQKPAPYTEHHDGPPCLGC